MGQHFLVDPFVLEKIIRAAEISENDVVLEVGPGLGAMTQALATNAFHVVAVELDKQLVPVLRELFEEQPVTVIQGDILRLDVRELLAHYNKNIKVVANLPYYITTPVLFYLFESGLPFESITVMIQKEVAERMTAVPGSKAYGSLSLAVQYMADTELVANVPVNCFMPRPGVDSAVVCLKLLKKPRVEGDKDLIFKLIHAAFGKRRKTLINALDSEGIGGGKENLEKLIVSCGFDPKVRGETLSLADYAKLANNIIQEGNLS